MPTEETEIKTRKRRTADEVAAAVHAKIKRSAESHARTLAHAKAAASDELKKAHKSLLLAEKFLQPMDAPKAASIANLARQVLTTCG